MSNYHIRLRTIAVVIHGLDRDLVRHVGGCSGHNELGNVGHVLGGPVLVHVLLSPLDLVLQTGSIGLKPSQLLDKTDVREKVEAEIKNKKKTKRTTLTWFCCLQATNTTCDLLSR